MLVSGVALLLVRVLRRLRRVLLAWNPGAAVVVVAVVVVVVVAVVGGDHAAADRLHLLPPLLLPSPRGRRGWELARWEQARSHQGYRQM